MEKFKYGISYNLMNKGLVTVSREMAICFSGIYSARDIDSIVIVNEIPEVAKKYREKYLQIINKIFPISWDETTITVRLDNPKYEIDMNINSSQKRLFTIFMLIRVLFDFIGSGFDNVGMLKLVTAIDIDEEDMLKAFTEVISSGKGWNKRGLWNSNHFLSSVPIRVVTKKEFYEEDFIRINDFFRKPQIPKEESKG